MTSTWHPMRRIWILLLGLLVLVAVIVFPSVRQSIRRAETGARLQHIQMAMECYHEANGCYPPQFLVDRQGRPAHSWRILLLPYLGYEGLYQRYHFDEPWSGPHNRLLATEMPEEYRSPFLDSASTITQYVGITGQSTLWQGTTPLRKEELLLGRKDLNTLVWFIEMANSDVNWMEPRDIPLEQALMGVSVPGGRGIQSNYSDGLPVQPVLGGWRWVPVGTSCDLLRTMFTIRNVDGMEEQERASGR